MFSNETGVMKLPEPKTSNLRVKIIVESVNDFPTKVGSFQENKRSPMPVLPKPKLLFVRLIDAGP